MLPKKVGKRTANTACVPSQAEFFQFPQKRKLEEIACRGKFPPSPLFAQKSQNVLPKFLIFHSFFCTNIPRNGIEDSVKFFHNLITERTLKTANRERKNYNYTLGKINGNLNQIAKRIKI